MQKDTALKINTPPADEYAYTIPFSNAKYIATNTIILQEPCDLPMWP